MDLKIVREFSTNHINSDNFCHDRQRTAVEYEFNTTDATTDAHESKINGDWTLKDYSNLGIEMKEL